MDSPYPSVSFVMKIADIPVAVNCFHNTTKRYCSLFLSEEKPAFEVGLKWEDLEKERLEDHNGFYVDEEITALCRKVSDEFALRDIVLFHSSAVCIDGDAYLIAAASGVGKSTHAALLQKVFGERLVYINDDKPFVKASEPDCLVYGSPWMGKEGRGNNISAPLKGILFLSRSTKPTYHKVSAREAYARMFNQIYLPKDRIQREGVLKCIDILARKASFHQIEVDKSEKSAIMVKEEVLGL